MTISNSGTTTIHRPHGGGTLVIRNRPPQHQHYIHKTPNTPAPISTTVNLPSLSENTVPDLDTAASYSTGKDWRNNKLKTILNEAIILNMQFHLRCMEYECRDDSMAYDNTAKFYNKTTADHLGQIAIAAETKTNEKANRTTKRYSKCLHT